MHVVFVKEKWLHMNHDIHSVCCSCQRVLIQAPKWSLREKQRKTWRKVLFFVSSVLWSWCTSFVQHGCSHEHWLRDPLHKRLPLRGFVSCLTCLPGKPGPSIETLFLLPSFFGKKNENVSGAGDENAGSLCLRFERFHEPFTEILSWHEHSCHSTFCAFELGNLKRLS